MLVAGTLIDLAARLEGLTDAEIAQIEAALPASQQLIALVMKAKPLIDQVQATFKEAEPLIATVAPALEIILAVVARDTVPSSSSTSRNKSGPETKK